MAAGKPEFLASLPSGRSVHLDVREDLRRGVEPFPRIMEAVKALGPGQVLVLRAPFEPLPLYGVLARRGFVRWAEARAPDDWTIWFWREQTPHALTLDVRGLEPPLPMLRILERLEQLDPGQRLVVVHERRPILLYPQLDHGGFSHETLEVGPGEFQITIWREGEGS
jgi:uncharacterized protein (DUF2249 family)